MQFKLFSAAAVVLSLGMLLAFVASMVRPGRPQRAAGILGGVFTVLGLGLMIGAAGTIA